MRDVREAAFKVKAPLELSRKPVFVDVNVWRRLYEKDLGQRMEKQAFPSLPGSFSTRFARAIATQSACCVVMPAGERRRTNTTRTQAAVRMAKPSGFAKQTEKGERSHRGELARIRDLPHLFHIDCRYKNAANFQCKRRFFVTFLTQESNVPLVPIVSLYLLHAANKHPAHAAIAVHQHNVRILARLQRALECIHANGARRVQRSAVDRLVQ